MGHYEQRFWLGDTWGMNRNERRSRSHHPYVPDALQSCDIRLSPSAAQVVTRAQADLALLNERTCHSAGAEPLARLILRSEAIASSKMEGLTMSVGKLLEHTDMAPYAGVLRESQNWTGDNNVNPLGAAYVPPVPERVSSLMEDLAAFVDTSILPAAAIAAIAHTQLETIRPFADGNGRTGRALVHSILRRADLTPRTIPPPSLVLATDKRPLR